MTEPAFDTLEAARRLKSAGIEVEHAEAILKVMGQSVSQLVTREHFSAELQLTREHFNSGIARLGTELHARIDGVEAKVQSLEATVRAEMHSQMMRAVLIMVGVLIPAIGLMLAFVQFYSAGGGGA